MLENKETVENIEQFLESASNNFGRELAHEMSLNVSWAKKQGHDFKIVVPMDHGNFATVLLVTSAFVRSYEVSKKRKVIVDQFLVGKSECRQMLELMESFER
ncbi:hypothetical protein [Bacillus infantis]|uniref:Uncharacterized protein n=1 Tax=Bacillus infantis TaxID=324767 RepID=A0A5D4RJW6_9BACI|nr:hypothetical protein [Bacillus infantis]TYS50114.1 hypothetical protein FZD51_06055 [Bacillus infantis]